MTAVNRVLPKMTCAGDCFPEEFKALKENGYGNLNLDAQVKWCAILEKIKKYKPEAETFLDVGGGFAATTFLMSKNGKVTNVDFAYTGNWFETNPDGTVPGLKDYNMENIKFIEMNFIEEGHKLPDNYFDVVMDGCAIIHFKKESNEHVDNIGLFESAEIIHKKMKNNGIFVVSSDINNGVRQPTAEWLTPESFVKTVESAGFKLIGDKNLNITNEVFDIGRGVDFLTVASFVFEKA